MAILGMVFRIHWIYHLLADFIDRIWYISDRILYLWSRFFNSCLYKRKRWRRTHTGHTFLQFIHNCNHICCRMDTETRFSDMDGAFLFIWTMYNNISNNGINQYDTSVCIDIQKYLVYSKQTIELWQIISVLNEPSNASPNSNWQSWYKSADRLSTP